MDVVAWKSFRPGEFRPFLIFNHCTFLTYLTRLAALLYLFILALCVSNSLGAGEEANSKPTARSQALRITKPQPISSTGSSTSNIQPKPTTTTTTISTISTTESSTTATTSDEEGGTSEQLAPLISSTTDSSPGSNPTAAGSLVPEICINGLQLATFNAQGEPVIRRQHELVQTIEGDVLISVLTSDPVSALFVINRVNQANLISADFEVGEQEPSNTPNYILVYIFPTPLRHTSHTRR